MCLQLETSHACLQRPRPVELHFLLLACRVDVSQLCIILIAFHHHQRVLWIECPVLNSIALLIPSWCHVHVLLLSGAVERWLLELEGVMRRTLHRVAGEALEAYPRTDRPKWILHWPGQLVLNCSQVCVRVYVRAEGRGVGSGCWGCAS